MANKQNPQTTEPVKPPKNPDVVHLNGRVLLRSVQRNTVFCALLGTTTLVISCMLYQTGSIALLTFCALVTASFVIPFFLLGYLIKICFIDGAMGALIIRGNKNQPITL